MMMSKDMRAGVWYGPNDLRLESRPIPEVVPGSLLVKVKACAICGSDLRIVSDGNPRVSAQRIIGHEISGEVAEVGAGVTAYKVGDRVSSGADVPCGKCRHCLSGRANCCDVNLAMGYQFDGGFADYVLLDPLVVTHGPMRRFSLGLSYEAAALAEPLACCINGYERALARPDASVVIFGGGPIGLMLASLAPIYQARRVILIEPVAARRAQAQSFGIDLVVDPAKADPVAVVMDATGGQGADMVFTACPSVEAHEQAIAMVAKRGVVNLFGGLPKSARPITMLSNHIHYREAYVTGSHGSTPEQHARALELIEAGKVDVSRFITHRFDLGRLDAAFAAARSREGLKVIVVPEGGTSR